MLKLRRLTTAMRAETPLVLSALDAKHLFETSTQRVKLLDVSWFMPNIARNPRDEFTLRRLSTAQFWDLDEIAAPHSLGLKHMMPSGQQFRRACGKPFDNVSFSHRLICSQSHWP
jgi:thiosulfate/3-mercaptopyruvate sulfurtransferase